MRVCVHYTVCLSLHTLLPLLYTYGASSGFKQQIGRLWEMITSCLIRPGLRVALVKLNGAAVKQGSVVWKCFRPTELLSKQAAWAAVVKSGLFEQV